MPKRTYALPPDGRRQLEITWQQNYRLLGIRLNGKWIGTINDLRSLQGQQKTFYLQDGSRITIQKNLLESGFSVLFNETFVFSCSTSGVSSAAHSDGGFALSTLVLIVITVVHVSLSKYGFQDVWMWEVAGSFLPLLMSVFDGENLPAVANILLFLSFVYFVLTIGVWRRSETALAIAVILFSFDTVWLMISTFTTNGSEPSMLSIFTLLCRIWLTGLLATGLAKPEQSNANTLAINPIRLFSSISRIILILVLLPIALLFDPFSVLWGLFLKNRKE
ncbi:MAG: hypothetical protein HC895_14685 [Leptolyngbyaceae cyanobacterium SM1_3_5]|nr:hypothetical protein [Leptolyngbyaceae cyanobacterium SM1_3_5]